MRDGGVVWTQMLSLMVSELVDGREFVQQVDLRVDLSAHLWGAKLFSFSKERSEQHTTVNFSPFGHTVQQYQFSTNEVKLLEVRAGSA